MTKPARPTTPEEEGVELHPGMDRFERLFDKVVKAPPVHRTGKPTGEDQSRKPRDLANAKSSR